MHEIIGKIEAKKEVKFIFCDYYDTVVHRTVHPLQTFKIWAKNLKNELGLEGSIEDVFQVRINAMKFLSKKANCYESELFYDDVIFEVYNRLINCNIISSDIEFKTFLHLAKESDYKAEACVQFRNNELVEVLSTLKEKGYLIYCVSDFHFDEIIMRRLLQRHDIEHLYDKVYVSAAHNASKENEGSLYKHILENENISGSEVFMIGDNMVSDTINAKKHGIASFYLKRTKFKINQKLRRFGSHKKEFNHALKKIEKSLNTKDYPYSEYIFLFHFFTERLYHQAKKNKVKNLFFLAREGQFLKKLFDEYQSRTSLSTSKIRTHYLKISRQGAMQISYKPLTEEKFSHLRSKYDDFSLRQFLKSFLFSEDTILEITDRLKFSPDKSVSNFFDSEIYTLLLKDDVFIKKYEENRVQQKQYFDTYIASFDVDFKNEGIHLVDVGWGGTMQECLYEYFNGEHCVEGYYLGLQEIYNITNRTKRKGLLFSVYPYSGVYDEIMMANRQLYEQLLAASHGSTLGYSPDGEYTVEFHKEEERMVFENYISKTQEHMFEQYDVLMKYLEPIIYDDAMVSEFLFNLKLRLDLQANKVKTAFIHNLTKGFYQNIGGNKVGLDYSLDSLGITPVKAIKILLLRPEKLFRYMVKVKPYLYAKKQYFLSLPIHLIKPYIQFNLYVRNKILSKKLT